MADPNEKRAEGAIAVNLRQIIIGELKTIMQVSIHDHLQTNNTHSFM
jgi:hypothetical protein